LTSNRACRYLRKAALYLVTFIHAHYAVGSVVALLLPNEDSHHISVSLTLTLSYIKEALQLYALIFSRKKFLDLIKYAEVNFFMDGKQMANTETSVVRSYVQMATRLTGFMYLTFFLTLSSVYFELTPTLIISKENYGTVFDGEVIGRRKTVSTVWSPFQNLDSPYLKIDIIYEIISVSVFFLIFTAINTLTLILIIFFTGHFNLLAECIQNHTKMMEKTRVTGIGTFFMAWLNESLKRVPQMSVVDVTLSILLSQTRFSLTEIIYISVPEA
jgi:hypothetical protein